MGQTSSITVPCMVGIVGRRKSVMFFVCLSRIGITKLVMTETMKQCYYQNNYGVIACRKVCSCAPVFNFFCAPQNFSIETNLYQKLR